jgi:L-amino acid N-acyltransferase
VRLARADDVEAIRAIYNVEVTTSTNVFDLVPRTSEEQAAWLEARSGAHAVVVGMGDDDDRVIAFGALSPYRPRPAYSTTVEDSVYVDRAEQGRGVGKAVLGRLVELAAAHGFHSVIGRIGGHNEASVAIHRSCGFELVGVEREVGRKFGRWLDVVVMQRLLDERDRAAARSQAE